MTAPHSRLLSNDILTVPVDLEVAEEAVQGTPSCGARTLDTIGEAEVGVWEITEGVVRDTEVDEIFVVVSGRGTVEFADGESIALSPGVAVRLTEGERTTWTITEPLRKIWIA